MNLYQYARSDPASRSDPFGLESGGISGYWDGYWEGNPRFNPTEEQLWKELWAPQKLCMVGAYRRALAAVSGTEYLGSLHNGDGDAVRHCVWNCEMSRCLGASGAKRWGDAHELNQGPEDERDMDLHNNDVGRRLWEDFWKNNEHRTRWHPDPGGDCIEPILPGDPLLNGECAKACKKAMQDGRLKVLPKEQWR